MKIYVNGANVNLTTSRNKEVSAYNKEAKKHHPQNNKIVISIAERDWACLLVNRANHNNASKPDDIRIAMSKRSTPATFTPVSMQNTPWRKKNAVIMKASMFMGFPVKLLCYLMCIDIFA